MAGRKDPRIVFATVPLRARSTHLPVGALSVLSALRRRGCTDLLLYDINVLRPPYAEVLSYFEKSRPDIVGISAVVSTSYQYVKQFAADVRRLLPETLIVCGGNLAAAAHVLLEKTEVDLCCTGEGEETMGGIVDAYAAGDLSDERLRSIEGIAFRSRAGEVEVTRFPQQLSCRQIYDIDWDLAAAAPGFRECFREDVESHGLFSKDARYYEPKRRGKSFGRFWTSKGCVARCTFCHRFHRGVRYVPVELLRERLRAYVARFNVGFLFFADECFATHEAWIRPFCDMIREFDVLWSVSGIRASNVSQDTLERMHAAGCTSVAVGFETGSEDMLVVMQKGVRLQDNLDMVRKLAAANIWYGPQTVIGMPGETAATIEETARFLQTAHTPDEFYYAVSTQLNYAQALPGTPIYEDARRRGLIAPTVDGEEAYLLSISDKNARDADATLNLTDAPYLVWRSWIKQVQAAVDHAFIRKFGIDEFRRLHLLYAAPCGTLIRDAAGRNRYGDAKALSAVAGGWDEVREAMNKLDREWRLRPVPRAQAPCRRARLPGVLIAAMYHLRWLMPAILGLRELRRAGLRTTASRFAEYGAYLLKGLRPGRRKRPVEPLRETVERVSMELDTGRYAQMAKLRLGR